MTLPRPVLIALLGVALCAAAFLATRSASDTNSAVTTVSPAHTPAVHKATGPAAAGHAAKAHKAAPAAQEPTVEKSGAATPAPVQPKPAAPAKPAKPSVSAEVSKTLPAIKALARGDVVVFFFTQPG